MVCGSQAAWQAGGLAGSRHTGPQCALASGGNEGGPGPNSVYLCRGGVIVDAIQVHVPPSHPRHRPRLTTVVFKKFNSNFSSINFFFNVTASHNNSHLKELYIAR